MIYSFPPNFKILLYFRQLLGYFDKTYFFISFHFKSFYTPILQIDKPAFQRICQSRENQSLSSKVIYTESEHANSITNPHSPDRNYCWFSIKIIYWEMLSLPLLSPHQSGFASLSHNMATFHSRAMAHAFPSARNTLFPFSL